jgi:translation initiation factor 2 alpha subunit (eIF-2alpha)
MEMTLGLIVNAITSVPIPNGKDFTVGKVNDIHHMGGIVPVTEFDASDGGHVLVSV